MFATGGIQTSAIASGWQGDEYPLWRNQILYSEIEGELERLKALNPRMMKVDVIGKSHQGREMYLVMIADEKVMADLDKYSKKMVDAVKDPEAAIAAIKRGEDYRAPVFINNGLHGNETPGVDGFDVTPVSYYDLNYGYDLGKAGFDAVVVAGSNDSLWDDKLADYLGNSYGVYWGLVERGRQQIIHFVKEGHDFIGVGFAGAKVNQAAGWLDVGIAYTAEAVARDGWYPENPVDAGGQTKEHGVISIDADPNDPITYSFGENHTVFAYSPIWYPEVGENAVIAARFAKGDTLQSGFWLKPENAGGQPVIIHDNDPKRQVVLMGIDPTFRNYTPATYRLMANALYYLGYDQGEK